jgi:phospholipid/cholesterol/gamma-HCH transport system substrate-binding protein
MRSQLQRTLVGLFVLVAAGILFFTLLKLTGGIGSSRVPMKTFFQFSGGLEPGGVVRYDGLRVGKVTHVQIDPKNSSRIEVDFAVDSFAPVKLDSVARVSQMGLLSENFLELTSGSSNSQLAVAGAELPSKESLGLDELEDSVAVMLPQTQKTITILNSDLEAAHETIDRTNDLLNPTNRAKVTSTLSNLDRTLVELRPELNKAIGTLNSTLADSDKAVVNANTAIVHVDDTISENRKDLRTSVTALTQTLAQTQALVTKLNATVNQSSDNLDDTLENIRQATENIRQLTDKLNTSPASILRGSGKERKPGDMKR